MSRASALLSGLAALLLVLVVGNPPANEAIQDELSSGAIGPGLASQATVFLSWDVFDDFGDLGPAAIVRTVLFIVLAALLGGIVGRSPKLPALIGGWGAGMIAAMVAGVGYVLVIDETFVVPVADPSLVDRASFGLRAGAIAGILPSLLIAVAVAIGARPKATVPTSGTVAPTADAWQQAPAAPPGAFGSPVPATDGTPPAAPSPRPAPPVAPTPPGPGGGPAVGAPPPRPGTTQPAPPPGAAPPGPTGASDETQRIPPLS